MKDLSILVKEKLMRDWVKKGMSDSLFQRIYDRNFEPLGYSWEEVDTEFESQIQPYMSSYNK